MSSSTIRQGPNNLQTSNQRGGSPKIVLVYPVRRENSQRGDKKHLNNVITSPTTLNVQVRLFLFFFLNLCESDRLILDFLNIGLLCLFVLLSSFCLENDAKIDLMDRLFLVLNYSHAEKS